MVSIYISDHEQGGVFVGSDVPKTYRISFFFVFCRLELQTTDDCRPTFS